MDKMLNMILASANIKLKEKPAKYIIIDNGVTTPYHNKTVISLDRSYWVTAKGEKIGFEDMETLHLSNTLLMLIRMCPEDRLYDLFSSVTFQGLIKEYRSRSDN